jgi:hypothetical protein
MTEEDVTGVAGAVLWGPLLDLGLNHAPVQNWTNTCFDATKPSADAAVYVNNLGSEGDERVRRAYGPTYQRLQGIKRQYDPTQPVPPQPQPRTFRAVKDRRADVS